MTNIEKIKELKQKYNLKTIKLSVSCTSEEARYFNELYKWERDSTSDKRQPICGPHGFTN